MQGNRLFWRIYGYFLAVAAGVLLVTAWIITHSLHQFHQDQVASDLLVRAQIFSREAAVLPGGLSLIHI